MPFNVEPIFFLPFASGAYILDAHKEHLREVLFLKETNDLIAVWEGAKYNKEEALEISGIKTVFWLSEFERVFNEMARSIVFKDKGEILLLAKRNALILHQILTAWDLTTTTRSVV